MRLLLSDNCGVFSGMSDSSITREFGGTNCAGFLLQISCTQVQHRYEQMNLLFLVLILLELFAPRSKVLSKHHSRWREDPGSSMYFHEFRALSATIASLNHLPSVIFLISTSPDIIHPDSASINYQDT